MNNHLCLIDGSAYIFRAYHAMPALTRKKDGLPIGAVAGFCNMLYKLLCNVEESNLYDKPTHLAIIFDHPGESFRKKLYPEYKSNRASAPDELKVQFDIIRKAVEAFNVAMVEMKGFEADDIICSYALKAAKDNARVTIISSDKDLMQLVDDNILMYDPVKDKIIDKIAVKEKWQVEPEQMVDLQAIAGDSSDNVPGVKGIGYKGAATLLEKYGDLDNIYANLVDLSKSQQSKLIEGKDSAFLSRKLVQLKKDIELDKSWQEFSLQGWSNGELLSFLKALELNKLLRRIAAEYDISPNDIEAMDLEVNWQDSDIFIAKDKNETAEENNIAAKINNLIKEYKQSTKISLVEIDNVKNLDNLLSSIKNKFRCAMDMKDNFLYITIGENELFYFDLALLEKEKLKQILDSDAILKICYDAKDFLKKLQKYYDSKFTIKSYDDIRLMSYVLNNENKLDLENLVNKYLVLEFNENLTVDYLYKLSDILKLFLLQEQQIYIYEQFEKPLIEVLHDMENCGIKIDLALLEQLSIEFAAEIAELEEYIYNVAGENFNLSSPKQLSYILYEKLKLAVGKKTKTGLYSTKGSILEDLAQSGEEIAQKILRWRQLTKLKNTYTDNLPKYCQKDQRIHTTYLLGATNTARLSSIEPNLQNIPIRGEEGKKIRQAFISEKDNILLSVDYNQIELRILTHIAGVKKLALAFSENKDIHKATAASIFNLELEEVTQELRYRAKAINFGIIYGMSAFGLSQQLQISASKAKEYIDAYFAQFPEIKLYMEQSCEFVKEHGYVETLFGRKIHFKNINKAKGPLLANLQRAAINARIQGSCADIMKLAMLEIHQDKELQNLKVKMLLQVHDELVFELKRDVAERAALIIQDKMSGVKLPISDFKIPLNVEIGMGNNWAEAH